MLRVILFLFVIGIFVIGVHAQTTEFTYQGSLKDGASTANGNYDFEFRLFDLVSGGPQQGSTIQRLNVVVTNGIFTVSLDFGSLVLSGADRYLDIAVRTAGGGAFTTLNPRQKINSEPYAVRSLSAATADSVIAGGIPAGNGNYIQNGISPQAANFNIAGTGTANIVNASTQFNLNGNRILSNPGTLNLFAGSQAGQATTGNENAFFGANAGQNNTTGFYNSFFGASTGQANTTSNSNAFFGTFAGNVTTTGSSNSFFGRNAGASNVNGFNNSIFGAFAGQDNISGSSNSFFGYQAGGNNTSGFSNSFFGQSAGFSTTTGTNNTFLGQSAGFSNTIGSTNTLIGFGADVDSGNLSFATAIGANAVVSQSNTVVLGRSSDIVRVPGSFNSAGIMSTNGNLVVVGTSTLAGIVDLGTLGAAGSQDICRNGSGHIATCSSSLKYKTNFAPFSPGLSLVNRLRPITFDWKDGGMHDLGLGAEDVEAIEPLLVTYNDKGQVEGVKYDRIGVVLVNAVKEQQSQIEAQQTKIESLEKQNQAHQKLIEAITLALCSLKPATEICKQKE